MADNQLGPVGVSNTALLVGGGVVLLLVVGGLWYAKNKIGDAVDSAVDTAKDVGTYLKNDAVNVTSSKNVANVAVNTLGQALGVLGTSDVTGQPNTLGSAVYDWFH